MATNKPLDLQLERFAGQLNLKKEAGKRWVQCTIRKQWLVLQPEEFVRQLLLHFLIKDMKYNRNRITVEKGLQVQDQQKRTDLLIFDRDMRPFMLVECKAPKVAISDKVFRQVTVYNGPLRVPYLMVTNGRDSYVAEIDYQREQFFFLPSVPEFPPR
ncbi:MAG: type I restriction enzyme HsdR N-terminal domain-containing protein [Bacteroidota bacterium]